MPQRSQRPPLSESQLEIMNLVWDRGQLTVAEVWSELSQRRNLARNTVQTMMVRLEEKRWLTHRTEGQAFLYRAVVPREATQKNIVRRLLDNVFEGSAEGLVMRLLEERPLSPEEAARIREMIEKATRSEP